MVLFVCLLDDIILDICYSILTQESGGFELTQTITVALQGHQLTKLTSHLKRCLNFSNYINEKQSNKKPNNFLDQQQTQIQDPLIQAFAETIDGFQLNDLKIKKKRERKKEAVNCKN